MSQSESTHLIYIYSREARCETQRAERSCLGSANIVTKVHWGVSLKKIYIYIFIYLDGCTEVSSDWLVGWLLGNKTMARRVASCLRLLCFSQLVAISESLLTLSEVSMRARARPKKITSQKRKSPTSTGPGLTRSTLTASACVRLYNILKMRAFPMSSSTKEKNGSG